VKVDMVFSLFEEIPEHLRFERGLSSPVVTQ
jgi:hypothetical protein